MKITKSQIVLCITAFMLVYISFNLSKWKDKNLLYWDCANYYVYLPATIIYHDLGNMAFYPGMIDKYYINNGVKDYGFFPDEKTGRPLNKYAIGTSVCQLPFFLLGHLYCQIDKSFDADGFSTPYLFCIVFSYVIWAMAGLVALRRLLLRYFSEGATALTLLLIMFATNLYFYIVFNIGMSHPYSFSMVCFLLLATDNFYRSRKPGNLIAIGILLGLITITRPNNLLFALPAALWPIAGGLHLRQRIAAWLQHKWAIASAIVLFLAIASLQLFYYRHITGSFFHYSYHGEGFNFADPQIYNGLFSYAKGWFVYTPLALFTFLGFIPLYKTHRYWAGLILGIVCIHIYVVFCWHDWEYGGGFSARALIELLPLMALMLAALLQYVLLHRRKIVPIVALTVFALCIVLNTFQSYQLSLNVTEWAHTNKAFYWHSFGKLKMTAEERELLHQR